ncbi:MAG: hypothetical protein EAZ34_08975 [Polaromonas sp.]|nr:MAG: hypothetical protein EAZ34_08975 [Polaromonas sp.]
MPKNISRRALIQSPALLAATAPIGLVLAPSASYAQITTLADAIEKAEALFMLSQRATKAYFAMGLGVRTQEAQKVLDASVQRFDRMLIELKAFAPTAASKKTYVDLGIAWVDLKIELMGKVPSKSASPKVITLNKKVFDLSGAGSNLFQEVAKTPISKLQDVAGNVRMLSQRMTKNYFRRGWGVQADAADVVAAPQSTAAIKAQIDMANNQWTLIETAVNSKKPPSASNYSDVWAVSENILSVMDGVCTAYFKQV